MDFWFVGWAEAVESLPAHKSSGLGGGYRPEKKEAGVWIHINLLGRPDSFTEHPHGLGTPALRAKVGADRIKDGGRLLRLLQKFH